MKILNLYAGIGGNRKMWGNEHEIIAIENIDYIAETYQKLYPQDKVILGDAHQYLLEHFGEFDFIWSSPPCPTHSKIKIANTLSPYKDNSKQIAHGGGTMPIYPDMSLYQEIILLKHFFKGKWVVENVEPYYRPLIHPTTRLDRHLFWSNFYIPIPSHSRNFSGGVVGVSTDVLAKAWGFEDVKIKNRRRVMRNVVDPRLGLHILSAASKVTRQEGLL